MCGFTNLLQIGSLALGLRGLSPPKSRDVRSCRHIGCDLVVLIKQVWPLLSTTKRRNDNEKDDDGGCVTSLLVDRKTREIKGAISDAYFQSIGEGVFAMTNDVFGAVRAKKDARYLKPVIDMKHGKGRCVYFWPSADGKVVFELLTQFVMSKQGQMSVNTLLHVYGDQINTKHVCQK